jgi:HD-GYP domain-containing protein (c-di-GMP phosphodiesterase class II)
MKLPYRAVRNIEIAALLHDLGKINFPDKAFTQKHIDYETWKIIKKHPEVSESIMNHLSDFRDITQYVSLHHERYDGSGYPNKLSLDDIPVAARILAVVDSFDAMTSNRAYRRAFPIEFALKEINDYKGKSYDPEVVDAFMSVISRVIADIEERLRKEDLTQKFAVRRYQ